jgi:tyrosinase
MTNGLRIRQSVANLSPEDLGTLRAAHAQIMSLGGEQGYQYIAGLHGLPPPSYCQHGNLLFLPWHRAYLQTLELALIAQEPGTAVPWWDWTSDASHRTGIPPAYAVPRTDGAANPLFDAAVDLPPALIELVRQRLPGAISDGAEPRTLRDPGRPSALPSASLIAGILDAPTFADFSARLEDVHNGVHVWVGGAMASVPTAGFDPVFYAHHGMIDRLWYLWQLRHPGAAPPAAVMNSVLEPFGMTVAETLDINTLGYDYATAQVA